MSASQQGVEVIGHGGAGDFFPGNSRQSIEQALKIGVDRIEFDVQLSAGGDIVLVHDEHMRLDDGMNVAVRAVPTEELRHLLPGLLTFYEACELIGGSAPLLIDIKSPGYERELIAAIRSMELGPETAVSSTHATVLLALRRAFPDFQIGLSTGHMATRLPSKLTKQIASIGLLIATPLPLLGAVRAIKATDVMIQYRVCSRLLVKTMHRNGIRVNTWTVDHPKHIQRMIAMGVDGIISNRPDLVKEELGRSASL